MAVLREPFGKVERGRERHSFRRRVYRHREAWEGETTEKWLTPRARSRGEGTTLLRPPATPAEAGHCGHCGVISAAYGSGKNGDHWLGVSCADDEHAIAFWTNYWRKSRRGHYKPRSLEA